MFRSPLFIALLALTSANSSAQDLSDATKVAKDLAGAAQLQNQGPSLEEIGKRFFPSFTGFTLQPPDKTNSSKNNRYMVVMPSRSNKSGYVQVYEVAANDLSQLQENLAKELPSERVALLYQLVLAEQSYRMDSTSYTDLFGLEFDAMPVSEDGSHRVNIRIRPKVQCLQSGQANSPGRYFKTSVEAKPFGSQFVKANLKPYSGNKSNLYSRDELSVALFTNTALRDEYFELTRNNLEYCRNLSPRFYAPWANNTGDGIKKMWQDAQAEAESLKSRR